MQAIACARSPYSRVPAGHQRQALQHRFVQPLALPEHPRLKCRRITHIEAFQKVGTIEIQCRLQLLGVRGTRLGCGRSKLHRIQPVDVR